MDNSILIDAPLDCCSGFARLRSLGPLTDGRRTPFHARGVVGGAWKVLAPSYPAEKRMGREWRADEVVLSRVWSARKLA